MLVYVEQMNQSVNLVKRRQHGSKELHVHFLTTELTALPMNMSSRVPLPKARISNGEMLAALLFARQLGMRVCVCVCVVRAFICYSCLMHAA